MLFFKGVHNLFFLTFMWYTIECSKLNLNNNTKSSEKIHFIPSIIRAIENDTILIPCHFTPTNWTHISWHKNGILLADSYHSEILSSDRFFLGTNGSIEISNVQATDAAEYYCEISNGTESTVHVYTLEVQYSPHVKVDPSGVIELPIGAQFEIVCSAIGVPQPTITWLINGESVRKYNVGNRQSYVFEINSRKLAGPIDCLAENGIGKPAISGIYLHVLFSPEIRIMQSVIYAAIGMRARLECIVEAAPAASVQWFHYGVRLQANFHMNIQDIEIQLNNSIVQYSTKIKHILTIHKLRSGDLGRFECRAKNNIGSNNTTIEITSRPMPCVFKINQGVQNSNLHVFVWQTESVLPILEFKLKFRQIQSGNITNQLYKKSNWTELVIPAELTNGPIYIKSYTLNGLQAATLYEAIVLAKNNFGWSDSSKTVRFASGGEVELPNYSTEYISTFAGSSENIFGQIDEISSTISASKKSGSVDIKNINWFKFIIIILLLRYF